MNLLQFLIPLGWIETVGPFLPIAILVVALINVVTRFMSHRAHKHQTESGEKDEALSRYTPHSISTGALLALGLLFVVYSPVSGMIITIPIAALYVVDFFEFEARAVEARNDLAFERPKAGLFVSFIVLIYAAYYGLQFLYGPYVDLIFA